MALAVGRLDEPDAPTAATSGWAQPLQNFWPGGFSCPQAAQVCAASRDAAHPPQKRESSGFAWPQAGHCIERVFYRARAIGVNHLDEESILVQVTACPAETAAYLPQSGSASLHGISIWM